LSKPHFKSFSNVIAFKIKVLWIFSQLKYENMPSLATRTGSKVLIFVCLSTEIARDAQNATGSRSGWRRRGIIAAAS
jgi:hypothetical protein